MDNKKKARIPWWIWVLLFLLVLVLINMATVKFAQGGEDHRSFLPVMFGKSLEPPNPDLCPGYDPIHTEEHSPVVDEPWYVRAGRDINEQVLVEFWTNQPGYPQETRMLRLEPGQNPPLLGGGKAYFWSYHCEDVVSEQYADSNMTKVTLEELEAEGLIWHPPIEPTVTPSATISATATVIATATIQPTATITSTSVPPTPTATATQQPPTPTATPDLCTEDPYTETHDSVLGFYWTIDASMTQSVVHVWTNFPGHSQELRKLRLHPEDGIIHFLGGGFLRQWPEQCTDEANAAYEADNLTAVTLEELDDEGLLFDPSVCE